MLVFTRKIGECLMIGDNVQVKVLSADRDHVRIGISAPREIPIHRQEIYDVIVERNKQASLSVTPPKDLLARLKI
jgi:carbon storage regulator